MPKTSRRFYQLSLDYVEWLHIVVISSPWPAIEGRVQSREERLRRHLSRPFQVRLRGELVNRSLLASALGRPFQTAFGKDAYPTIQEKAAALFHSLIANHPFFDGNKRTAVLALVHFLLANGWFPVIGEEELFVTAKEAASYREKGMAHQRMYQGILILLQVHTLPVSDLKGRVTPAFYQELLSLTKWIRRENKRGK